MAPRLVREHDGGGSHHQEGDPLDEILQTAREKNVDMIFSPPAYKSLVKAAPCPVSIIPGHILVPLDNTDVPPATLERISEEALATGSKVILLGIVPIHIYGSAEKAELERIRKETAALLKQVRKDLSERQVEAKEIIHSGYPDEEILTTADETSLTMIIMPAAGNEPSELSKAAAILSDRESGAVNRPLLLMHPAT